LSPDGKYLIYFARGGRRHAETKGSWTAVSRAPWLKAVTLWGKGDCWQGGGLFTSNDSYWLNGCHFLVRKSGEVRQDLKYRARSGFGAECLSVYFPRLLRDGWRIETEVGPHRACLVFVKDLANGWVLRKFAYADVEHPQGAGCYWDEHELEYGGRVFDRRGWEWADRDGDSVVWAEGGVLRRGLLGVDGLKEERVLRDFNDLEFRAIQAPY
jgi:hypothetical protein